AWRPTAVDPARASRCSSTASAPSRATTSSSPRSPRRRRPPPSGVGQPVDAAQRARLLQVKLGALVAGHTGTSGGTAGRHAGAATLLRDGAGWFLADDDPHRALGPALAWARQQAAATLHVVVDDPGVAGVLARRATAFVDPPTVWSVDGRDLVPAEPAGHP